MEIQWHTRLLSNDDRNLPSLTSVMRKFLILYSFLLSLTRQIKYESNIFTKIHCNKFGSALIDILSSQRCGKVKTLCAQDVLCWVKLIHLTRNPELFVVISV